MAPPCETVAKRVPRVRPRLGVVECEPVGRPVRFCGRNRSVHRHLCMQILAGILPGRGHPNSDFFEGIEEFAVFEHRIPVSHAGDVVADNLPNVRRCGAICVFDLGEILRSQLTRF